ncbi:MAG: hypothetical protein HETSPECPRED_000707 [Heterodermia speciosa]|uniref:UBX domain-containing protein n=1 Tax=Heterodermia speciosa TaxID=116794 RepID=A0A8H3G6W0_9LECA|nr:MAG: hypothetical protein HETSPECPRED_000707 [Heterodermia speciosa]
MSSSEIDIAQLTESQQLALGTYTSVTNQDPSPAVDLLRRSEWNVQIAIAKFFDGEAPDPVAEARASQQIAPPQPEIRRRELLQNGFGHPSRSIIPLRRDPAPRIVPRPERQLSFQPPLILTILFTPFNLVYRLLCGTLRFLGTIIPFRRFLENLGLVKPSRPSPDTTQRGPLNPRDTALRFSHEFNEQYGNHNLPFFEDGYAQAYDLAKKELKFLLVVLLSPEDDETEAFVRGTLLSEPVVSFINDPRNNIILWAGTVQDSEAYQVSKGLKCSKFPYAAFISHTPQDSTTSMSTIARISGLTTASTFVSRLQTAISQQKPALEQARATKNEQQASRTLRSEQNSAYERSLAQDRERARQKREAHAAQSRAEQEEKAAQEARENKERKLERWRLWRVQSITAAPDPAFKNVSRISLRLTSGERVIRHFDSNAPLEELYAFVECYDALQFRDHSAPTPKPEDYEHEFGFRLVTPVPRVEYDVKSTSTIGQSIGRSGNLIVESIGGDDDDED